MGGLVRPASCRAAELTYRNRTARNATVQSGRDTRTKSVIPLQADGYNLPAVKFASAATTISTEERYRGSFGDSPRGPAAAGEDCAVLAVSATPCCQGYMGAPRMHRGSTRRN